MMERQGHIGRGEDTGECDKKQTLWCMVQTEALETGSGLFTSLRSGVAPALIRCPFLCGSSLEMQVPFGRPLRFLFETPQQSSRLSASSLVMQIRDPERREKQIQRLASNISRSTAWAPLTRRQLWAACNCSLSQQTGNCGGRKSNLCARRAGM